MSFNAVVEFNHFQPRDPRISDPQIQSLRVGFLQVVEIDSKFLFLILHETIAG
jgi:hypothetical protein